MESLSEPYTRLSLHPPTVYADFEDFTSSKQSLPDAVFTAAVRAHHPNLNLTKCVSYNVDILGFAAAGYARAELDSIEDSLLRTRYYFTGPKRQTPGGLGDAFMFSKYRYRWMDREFIVYHIGNMYYILTEPGENETIASHCELADKLIHACGETQSALDREILVYDGYWSKSRALYEEVQKADWRDVILNEDMKTTLMETMERFFDSEEQYRNLNVPWKRGIIFWGPPGNGKTISLKALMKSLSLRKDPIPTLYVKNMGYGVRNVFVKARQMAPCVLVLEDIDTQLSPAMRSYFFNELDGLEDNNGLFLIATTNHLERLDPGLVKRPSRFDRKYLFPLPSFDERVLYCDYWRRKLHSNAALKFPPALSPAIAEITSDFSFAYLKEAFVASLLALAHQALDSTTDDNKGPDINDLPLWIEMQKQVRTLREDMDNSKSAAETGNAASQDANAMIQPNRGPCRPPGRTRYGCYTGDAMNCFGNFTVPGIEGFGSRLTGAMADDDGEDFPW